MKLRTSRSIAGLLSPLLLAVPVFTSAAHAEDQGTAQGPAVHQRAHKKPAPLVLPPLPAGPLSQVPMDQLPAAAPTVTYQNGLLSVSAQNATLGDVLREVRKLTGATIDIPPAGASERVVVQLGPGAPRDVLATLLNGTSFNYVMMGSPSDPASVATVMLTPRVGGAVQTAVNTPPAAEVPPAFQQVQQPPVMPVRAPIFRSGAPVAQPAAADDEDDADADDKDDDSDQAQTQPPAQIVQPNPEQAQSDNQDEGNLPNGGPRTPEQILQMIRNGQRPGPPGVPPGQQPPQQ